MVVDAGSAITALVIAGVILLIAIASLILMIWSIVDIVTAKNDNSWKTLWIVVVALIGLIGFILYLVLGRKDRKK